MQLRRGRARQDRPPARRRAGTRMLWASASRRDISSAKRSSSTKSRASSSSMSASRTLAACYSRAGADCTGHAVRRQHLQHCFVDHGGSGGGETLKRRTLDAA
mmetsp:Transcript_22303/g.57297  ORF Transcript_22303/g.57297 Transcript_22303/m.57297 type:complete len:103 (+) Transcript_22303:692-1000(+)